MGWSIGYDQNWDRDIGYSVICECDHPRCNKVIDRGLAYVCGGQPYGGEKGCGLFFCSEHLLIDHRGQLCPKCHRYEKDTYKPKPELREWIAWKCWHESWEKWRSENHKKVEEYEKILSLAPKVRR